MRPSLRSRRWSEDRRPASWTALKIFRQMLMNLCFSLSHHVKELSLVQSAELKAVGGVVTPRT
jgi:hypothetical protein